MIIKTFKARNSKGFALNSAGTIVLASFLASCSQEREQQTVADQDGLFADQQLLDAQREIAQLTKDPAAAQFQNVTSANEGIVCGEVNPKNAFGAYDGFRPFVVGGKGGPLILNPGEEKGTYFQDNCVRDKAAWDKPNACRGTWASEGGGQRTRIVVGEDSVYGVHGELYPSGTSQYYVEEGLDSFEYDPFTSKEVRFSMNILDTDGSSYFRLVCDGREGRLYQADYSADSLVFSNVFHPLSKKSN